MSLLKKKKRRKFEHRDRYTERASSVKTREKDHGNMEAEVGVMLPQAKELLGFQKLEEARKNPILQASEGHNPAYTDFSLLAPRTLS